VSHAYIIPEVIASATAIRKLKDVKSAFMVVSLGYGTLETTLSIAEEQIGLQRTSNSSYGLLYAINALKNELSGIYNSMAVDN
jgi:threonine/homoserine efflux transporter RhtA